GGVQTCALPISSRLRKRLHPIARIHCLSRSDFLSPDGFRFDCSATKSPSGRQTVSDVGLSNRADYVNVAGRFADCRSFLSCADNFRDRNLDRADGRAGLFLLAEIGGRLTSSFTGPDVKYIFYSWLIYYNIY